MFKAEITSRGRSAGTQTSTMLMSQRTVADKGAGILHMCDVVRVTQPAVAAELFRWVRAARLYRLAGLSPVLLLFRSSHCLTDT